LSDASEGGEASGDPAAPGLLAGVRILDLSVWRPGPYATALLGQLGAEVLKVEPPGGDPMRTYPALFSSLNRDKRSILLDLKTEAGRNRALELAAQADVVVEGFRPGVVDRLGVGPAAVRDRNPSVIYASLSGYGQTGPLADHPGHDLNYQALAGVLSPEGGEPVTAAVPIADLAAGLAAAFAVCAALHRRAVSGEGEVIDLAMADVLATWTGAAPPRAGGTGSAYGEGTGPVVPGYGTFTTADGGRLTVAIVSEDHFWAALCEVLDLPQLAGQPWAARHRAGAPLQTAVAQAVARRPLGPLLEALTEAGVPCAPVLDRDGMLAHPQFLARGVSTRAPGGDGPEAAVGPPVRLVDHPGRTGGRAPDLDEHRGQGFGPRPGVAERI
jgi:crotonobetainyl-CoA:carnitine CoA-transferase CaiB-like acyl-CoA transferase